jgi:hypothetical protein
VAAEEVRCHIVTKVLPRPQFPRENIPSTWLSVCPDAIWELNARAVERKER